LTVVPISCYNKGSLLKLEIALAKGRKDIEKRKLEKRREIEREKEKEVKKWMRG
jgi:SsrA-binding protein